MTREQIRGSGLLLSGRGLSTGLKFLAELLIVRHLATDDYGAWTYALSAVAFLRGFAALGLHRAIVRFLPVHLERGDARHFRGVLILVLGSLLLACAAVVGAFYLFPSQIARLAGAGPGQRLDLLFIVILLIPLDTLDDFLTAICAAFASSHRIFVRRYLLSPGLRIVTALLLVALHANVRFLAYGYVVAGIIGIGYYAASVLDEMRSRGLADWSGGVSMPAREVFGYTVPVMAADWCGILLVTMGPLLLGYFADLTAVALFQVVVPLVTLIRLVSQTFSVLFEPAASRLHVRGDRGGLDELYWKSAAWVAVLTFPAFALSFTAAGPLSTMLFGERYAASAPILSILALGTFCDSLLGFSAPTLRVVGRTSWLLWATALAAAIGVALNVALIPRFGALGASVGTGACWVLFVVFKQAALHFAAGVRAFDRDYAAPYLIMAVAFVGLAFLRVTRPDDTLLLLSAVAVASLAVFAASRAVLSISDTFPQVGKVRLMKRVLG